MALSPVPLLMLLTSVVSASCCVAPAARATRRERAMALALAAAMATVIAFPGSVAAGVGAAIPVALGCALLAGPPTLQGRVPEAHRAAGSLLMALALVLPGTTSSPDHGQAVMPATAPAGTSGLTSDFLTVAHSGLTTGVILFLGWTAFSLGQHRRHSGLRRAEHLTMAGSLALMMFGMG